MQVSSSPSSKEPGSLSFTFPVPTSSTRTGSVFLLTQKLDQRDVGERGRSKGVRRPSLDKIFVVKNTNFSRSPKGQEALFSGLR